LTHTPPQRVVPGTSHIGLQVPSLQNSSAPQALAQLPQFALSLLVLTQVPPQSV